MPHHIPPRRIGLKHLPCICRPHARRPTYFDQPLFCPLQARAPWSAGGSWHCQFWIPQAYSPWRCSSRRGRSEGWTRRGPGSCRPARCRWVAGRCWCGVLSGTGGGLDKACFLPPSAVQLWWRSVCGRAQDSLCLADRWTDVQGLECWGDGIAYHQPPIHVSRPAPPTDGGQATGAAVLPVAQHAAFSGVAAPGRTDQGRTCGGDSALDAAGHLCHNGEWNGCWDGLWEAGGEPAGGCWEVGI